MKSNLNKQQGTITLGLVFGLGMLGLGIAATTLLFATASVTNNSMAGSGIRSLVTADAAAREGIYRVLESYDAEAMTIDFTDTTIPLLNNADTADVAVTGDWPVYEVRSTSGNSRTTRKVVAELNLFPSAFVFDQAVYTDGELNLGGNSTINGDVYATNGIDIGGSTKITQDSYSPADINTSGSAKIIGTSTDNYEIIEPPIIDVSPYLGIAQTNNTYYGSGSGAVFSSVIKNTNSSGTYYIDDNVTLSANGTSLTGTLIVIGDLTISGGTFTSNASNPLVIYVSGNLNLSGNPKLNGIVYVAGETTFGTGGPEIKGALISVNGASKASGGGNLTITYDPSYAEAWANIVGLDTESGTSPQINDWHEE